MTAPRKAAPERNGIMTPRLIFYVRFSKPQKIVERTQMRFELASLLSRIRANQGSGTVVRTGVVLTQCFKCSPTKTEIASAA